MSMDRESSLPLEAVRRVFIVRHAQTVENEHLISLTNAFIDLLLHWRIPDVMAAISSLAALLKFEANSELSLTGIQQVRSPQ